MRLSVLLSLVILGCGSSIPEAEPVVLGERLAAGEADDAAVERQLRGHLARARRCYDEARRRNGALAGWVRVEMRIAPAGHVGAARVVENTSGSDALARCFESRLGGLRFDPPPTRPVEVVRDFVLCPHDAPGVCALGPLARVGGAASGDADRAVAEAVGERAVSVEECAATTGADAPALFDVELRVEPDGRIQSGRVRQALPASTDLRTCAVAPILGARVPELSLPGPATYRMTYVVRPPPRDETATASR